MRCSTSPQILTIALSLCALSVVVGTATHTAGAYAWVGLATQVALVLAALVLIGASARRGARGTADEA